MAKQAVPTQSKFNMKRLFNWRLIRLQRQLEAEEHKRLVVLRSLLIGGRQGSRAEVAAKIQSRINEIMDHGSIEKWGCHGA